MTNCLIPCRNVELNPEEQTIIMGVLNVTPDSFSDGGRYLAREAILNRARQLMDQGAHIIDVGGESTRPFSKPVSVEEELNRVIPAIEAIRSVSDCPISIDTTKAEVARQALEAGADIINDISALRFDPEMVHVAANYGVPVILMHMKGTPQDMQKDPSYHDLIGEIKSFFKERIDFAVGHGIPRERLIIDPGIGFGKRFEDNLDLINDLSAFLELELPILIGPSRKAFLGSITGKERPEERDNATCAAVVAAILNGASLVRIHEVGAMIDAIKVADALKKRREKTGKI